MKKTYTFKCPCGHITPTIGFVADHFLPPRSEYLNLLPSVWWDIDQNGEVHYECDGHPWPEELSKRYFGNEARKFARKILKGGESLCCNDCGGDLVITKS